MWWLLHVVFPFVYPNTRPDAQPWNAITSHHPSHPIVEESLETWHCGELRRTQVRLCKGHMQILPDQHALVGATMPLISYVPFSLHVEAFVWGHKAWGKVELTSLQPEARAGKQVHTFKVKVQ